MIKRITSKYWSRRRWNVKNSWSSLDSWSFKNNWSERWCKD